MDDPVDGPAATYAAGNEARSAGDLPEADRRYRQAIREASEARDRRVEVHARLSVSTLRLLAGDVAGALALCDEAATHATGLDRARVRVQRGAMLAENGRTDEAFAEFDRADRALRRSADTLWRARLHNNRGMLSLREGRFRAAYDDLVRAHELFAPLGVPANTMAALHNLGLLAARRGDVVGALDWFARADDAAHLGGATGADLLDRGVALLDAHLTEEALDAGTGALTRLSVEGNNLYLPQARLLVAEASLALGDATTALEHANAAAGEFRGQRRPRWTALSRFLALRARLAANEESRDLARALAASARDLEKYGWSSHALQANLIAGSIRATTGSPGGARVMLRTAARHRHRGLAADRVNGWHAEARLRVLDGDRRGAESAARAGLRVLDAYRATLGAAELRARLAAPATELARFGLQLAFDADDDRRALDWAERARALSLLRPPSPSRSAGATDRLAELREVVARAAAATDPDDAARWRLEQARLERAIRDDARRVPAQGDEDRTDRARDILDALGERVLVEFVASKRHLVALVAGDGRVRRFDVGAGEHALREQRNLAFAMRRLARADLPDSSRASAAASAAASAVALDNVLLGPLRGVLGDRSVVLVPTGGLHSLPWPLLASLSGRTFTVSPSATIWRRLHARRRRRGPTGLVAGPGLPGAASEVRRLGRTVVERTVLTGRAASADAVSTLLPKCSVAHIAAHGRFRADHPMLSSLRLADGPLTVYDLERLRSVPDVMVLSACDAGLSAVHSGDELMGFAATLFALGTRTLVASVLPVPDGATVTLMLAFHRHLQAGEQAAAALARAQHETSSGRGIAARAAAASFVCLGA